jgi:hypothetical protein
MNYLWRNFGRKKERSEDNTDITLGTFRGTCYNCGTSAHMANDRRKPKKNDGDSGGGHGGNKFKDKCNNCGMFGRMIKDCFEDEKNASKHPTCWKSKKEHGNVDVDGGGGNIALFLYGMTFPDDPKIILSKDMWVADSGAETHITPHDDGMMNMVAPSASGIVIMGNGTPEGTKAVGKIPGILCDNNGNEKQAGALDSVNLVTGENYNLINITRMLNQGWKLCGDNKTMRLTKDDNTLVFDVDPHHSFLLTFITTNNINNQK